MQRPTIPKTPTIHWRRDRLAGVATDGMMIALTLLAVWAFNSLHVQYSGNTYLFSGWREVLLLVLFVGGVLSSWAPVEDFLYLTLKRLFRPRLIRIQTSAESLLTECTVLFDLGPLLDRLRVGLTGITGSGRIEFYLLDEEEQVLVLQVDAGSGVTIGVPPEIPLEGATGEELARTRTSVEIRPDRTGGPANGEPVLRALVPLHTGGVLTGAVLLDRMGAGAQDRLGIETAEVLLGRLGVLIEDARLYALARRETLEKDLLFEVGRRISAALDLDELLDLILDGLARVVGFDAAGIFIVERPSKQISHHILRGYDTSLMRRANLKLGTGLVGIAAESREPILVADVREHSGYVEARTSTRSEIVLPVLVEGEVIAVINLESDRIGAYRQKDLDLLKVFGSQAAIALQNARLYREARERRSLEQELELAGEIQRALLPRRPPEIAGLQTATFFLPSSSVGGDLYDLVSLSDGRMGVAIGDVSGKGTPAAILMASLYASFRSVTRGTLTLPQVMRRLNNLLCENFGSGRYATFVYAVFDPVRGELTYSNAGHFPPLLLRPGEEPRPLSEGGIVLGYIPDSDYQEGRVSLESGDLVVFYTDGLVEAQNPEGEMFGEERVAEVAATLIGRSAVEVLGGLRHAVESHGNGVPLGDDMTLVVLRRD